MVCSKIILLPPRESFWFALTRSDLYFIIQSNLCHWRLPMTIFDLLFIVVFFAVIVMLVLAGVAALRGRRARAIAISRWLGIVAGLYLGIVILVSLISPRR